MGKYTKKEKITFGCLGEGLLSAERGWSGNTNITKDMNTSLVAKVGWRLLHDYTGL